MKQKIWVIGALLLSVATTGLAQNYQQVITRTLDTKLDDKKIIIEPTKTGTVSVTEDYLQIDKVKYIIVERKVESPSADYKYVTYTICNTQDKANRTYNCVLSYDKRDKLLLVEIWKTRLNCIYYVLTKNLTPASSIANTRLPAFPPSRSGTLINSYNQK